MEKKVWKVVVIGMAALGLLASGAYAATATWYGARQGGDGTSWTDSHNWLNNYVPVAGDTVQFRDDPTNGDQTITVPSGGVSVTQLSLQGTTVGYTFNGGTFQLGSASVYGIYNNANKDVTINNNLTNNTGSSVGINKASNKTATLTLNGQISYPQFLIAQGNGTSKVIMSGNNSNLVYLQNHTTGELRADSLNSLGQKYSGYNGSLVSLNSDINVDYWQNFSQANQTSNLRNVGASTTGRTLYINKGSPNSAANSVMSVGANPDGGSSALTIRYQGTSYGTVNWLTRADTTFIFGDTVSQAASITYGHPASTAGFGVISGGGNVIVDSTDPVGFSLPMTYTGGTAINRGNFFLHVNNGLPSGGNLSLAGGTTVELRGYAQTLGNLTGGGSGATIDTGGGTLTLNGMLSLGANPGDFGTINTVNGIGSVVLGSSSNSVFDLKTVGIAQDSMSLTNDNLILNGMLTINAPSDVAAGTYTLFNILGTGTFSGSFSGVTYNLPSGWTGSIDYSSPTAVSVTLVPEPLSLILLGMGAMVIGYRKKR